MRHKLQIIASCCFGLLLSAASLQSQNSGNALVDAAKNQNKEAVVALLKQRADVNAPQADGSTALHWAAHWNDLDTADLLIRAGAKVNAATDIGVTPLYVASVRGSTAMVEKLLAAGANPNIVPSTGVSPLMTAARAGSAGAVQALLAHEADPNMRENARGQTALMWAVTERHPEVVRILVQRGADVHARSNSSSMRIIRGDPAQVPSVNASDTIETGGSTALLFAARVGEVECAKFLLDAGANINDTSADGNSALVVAAHSGHGAFAAFLLDKGADPNADRAGYTALHAAVLRNDLDLVKTLLAHHANLNPKVTKATPYRRNSVDIYIHASLAGATPLLLASKYASVNMIRTLAEAGADFHLTANDGATPLLAAASANRQGQEGDLGAVSQDETLPAVKILLELGADVNAVNPAGDTALHIAAGRGFNTVVQLLVDRGANLETKNKRGLTPMAIASARPQLKNTADLLSKLGAKE